MRGVWWANFCDCLLFEMGRFFIGKSKKCLLNNNTTSDATQTSTIFMKNMFFLQFFKMLASFSKNIIVDLLTNNQISNFKIYLFPLNFILLSLCFTKSFCSCFSPNCVGSNRKKDSVKEQRKQLKISSVLFPLVYYFSFISFNVWLISF